MFYIRKYETQNNIGSYSKNFEYLKKTYPKKRAVTRMSRGETACRQFLESTFRKPFPSVRPSFLYNDATGQNLELDMYNRFSTYELVDGVFTGTIRSAGPAPFFLPGDYEEADGTILPMFVDSATPQVIFF